MRILSILICAFAISAIAGGIVASKRDAPRVAVSALRASPPAASASADLPKTDELAHDGLAGDPAVVAQAVSGVPLRAPHVALVLVDCGHSFALETPFVLLDVPMTVVIDPAAPAAHDIADVAAQAGDEVYLQQDAAPDAHQAALLHDAFPGAEGIAARIEDPAQAAPWIRAAKGENLAFLDEFSRDAATAALFAKAGVRYAGRAVTIDDHQQQTYIEYLFAQAQRIGRSQTAVTFARPTPITLRALRRALASSAKGTQFVHLP